MKFSEFRRYKPNPGQNVFVMACGDELLIDESRQLWAAAFSGNWNVERLHVKEFEEIESSRLSDDALTPSLFSQNRAIMVSSAEKLTKGRIDDLVSIQNVANSSLKVILVVEARKSADSRRSGEGLSKMFPVVEIDELKPAEVARWLMDRFQLSPEIARYMVENVGMELYTLHNEMEKLRTYAGESRPIEVRDIDVLILRSEQFGPFELDDAILARNYTKAVRMVGAMIEEGVEPLLILAKIVRVWRQLFVGKGLAGKCSAKDVAAAAGAPAWKAAEFLTGCRKYEWKQLAQGFRELVYADRAFKTSSPRPEVYLDVLLWKIMLPATR